MMQGFAYFPAIVYRDERPDLIEEVLPVCMAALDKVRNDGAWALIQSEHLGSDIRMQKLMQYLLCSSVDILRTQGYITAKYDFYFQGLWAQELQRGAGTNVHIHKNSQICGWMFLDAPENGAYPIYHDTRANKPMSELDYEIGSEVNNATGSIHFNNVIPGTVMFSNSWMQHQLANGNAQTPTRCIHFIISHRDR